MIMKSKSISIPEDSLGGRGVLVAGGGPLLTRQRHDHAAHRFRPLVEALVGVDVHRGAEGGRLGDDDNVDVLRDVAFRDK